MGKLYNLARMSTATAGTGTITLGSAVSGYLTFALAGVANGDVVDYAIKDGANSEIGTGTYTSAGTTLTRTVTKSTNSDAAISLSGNAEVFISPRAETLNDASLITTGTLAETRGGTSQSTWTLGDLLYSSSANTLAKLAGNTTTTRKFLSQTGNGAVSAAPTWEQPLGSDISFTQTGTGANATTIGALFSGKVYTPEMFGAAPVAVGTAAASCTDCTVGMQECIDALAAIGGGTMYLGPGVYATTGITVANRGVYIEGEGPYATFILHKPTGASTAVAFGAGASILYGTGIKHLTVASADTTYAKVGIGASDVSNWNCENVTISFYPVDGTLFRGGANSQGIKINGREGGQVADINVYADQPLYIGVNPNSATIDMDSWTFENCSFFAGSTTLTNHVVTVEDGVAFFNTRFNGHQNWIGGIDGFHMVASGATNASFGLTFEGIKSEQTSDSANGYTFNIQANTTLSGLSIKDSLLGDRNAIKLRNCLHPTIGGIVYDCSASTGKEGLNIDSSAVTFQIAETCRWLTGTTATISGLNVAQSDVIPSGTATIPPRAFYTSSASTVGETFNYLTVTNNVSATTFNNVGLSSAGSTASISMGSGKTMTVNNTIILTGTDGTTITTPTTSATMARTDAAQTFTGTQTFGAIAATTVGATTANLTTSNSITANSDLSNTNSAATAFQTGSLASYYGTAATGSYPWESAGRLVLQSRGNQNREILFVTGSTPAIRGGISATASGRFMGTAATDAGALSEIVVRKTGIADNTATGFITVTVPNANHNAAIFLDIVGHLGTGTDASESTRCASGCIVLARTTGVATVATASTLTSTQIATVAGGGTLTLAYDVSAMSGAVGATQTFTIRVTMVVTGTITDHTAIVHARLVNSAATGVSMAAA